MRRLSWVRGGTVIFALSVLSLVGCQEQVGDSRLKLQAVLDGEQSKNDSVVVVRGELTDAGSICTGTLIAPRLVLTARHCVSEHTDGQYTCTIDGELDLSRPRQPANAGEMGALLSPDKLKVHVGQRPSWSESTAGVQRVLAPETNNACRNDIALLVLEEEAPGTIAQLRLGKGVSWKEKIRVVGYGQNELNRVERRELGGLSILGIGPSEFFEQEGQAMPRTFVVGRASCPGDSGGPAFSEETGEQLGVFSLFRGDCTSNEARNFYTQVAPFEELLREGFEAAGAPWPVAEAFEEGEADPEGGEVGAGGDGGSAGESRVSTNESRGGCQLGQRGKEQGTPVFMFFFMGLLAALRTRRWESV